MPRMVSAIRASAMKIARSNDHDAKRNMFALRTFFVRLPHEISRIEIERLWHGT